VNRVKKNEKNEKKNNSRIVLYKKLINVIINFRNFIKKELNSKLFSFV